MCVSFNQAVVLLSNADNSCTSVQGNLLQEFLLPYYFLITKNVLKYSLTEEWTNKLWWGNTKYSN